MLITPSKLHMAVLNPVISLLYGQHIDPIHWAIRHQSLTTKNNGHQEIKIVSHVGILSSVSLYFDSGTAQNTRIRAAANWLHVLIKVNVSNISVHEKLIFKKTSHEKEQPMKDPN